MFDGKSFIIAINTRDKKHKNFVYLDVEWSHSQVSEHQGADLAATDAVMSHGFLWSVPQGKVLQEHSAMSHIY